MSYNFDEVIPMRGSGAIKWDQWEDENIIGMANADMDFRPADCVIDALTETVKRGMDIKRSGSLGRYPHLP